MKSKRIVLKTIICLVLIGLSLVPNCTYGFDLLQKEEPVKQTAVTDKIVIIDPGHGGFDPGKPGLTGEDEKHLNLKIALKLKEYLENSGAKVIMTRASDDDVDGIEGEKHKSKDMVERKKIAEGGDILISIHQNAFGQPNVKGAQTFYNQSSEKGKVLATLILDSIKKNADPSNRRVAKSNTSYYVLKATDIPSVIVECGFLTCP